MDGFEFLTDDLLHHLVLLEARLAVEEGRRHSDIIHGATSRAGILDTHVSRIQIGLYFSLECQLLGAFQLLHRAEAKSAHKSHHYLFLIYNHKRKVLNLCGLKAVVHLAMVTDDLEMASVM